MLVARIIEESFNLMRNVVLNRTGARAVTRKQFQFNFLIISRREAIGHPWAYALPQGESLSGNRRRRHRRRRRRPLLIYGKPNLIPESARDLNVSVA